MSVQIEPEQFLTFQRPLTRVVEETLTIRNNTSSPIAFKVKTTAPKQYCVRPNSGLVNPNSTRDVAVMLQPFKMEPELDYRCKDKFLVQTVQVPADKQLLPINDLWAQTEANDVSSISQHKLRCAFLPVNAEAHQEPLTELTNGTAVPTLNEPHHASPERDVSNGSLHDDFGKTQDQMLEMKEKLQAYERELEAMRQRSQAVPSEVVQATQGYPIQVLVMVAIAVFAMSYAIFGTKQ
ncbi:PapD-like protein [Fennellomyces sp. T-0311]|nr:PapD-like protein [Fennellomyces sp. T-0311]